MNTGNLTKGLRAGDAEYQKARLEQLRLEVFEAMRTAELNAFLTPYYHDLYRIKNSIELDLKKLR
jgi:hypothetical protein